MRTLRLARIGWLALVAAAGARGQKQEIAVGHQSTQPADRVRVCVNSNGYELNPASAVVLARAEDLASRMLATAGVALEWRPAGAGACRKGERARTIMLDFATGTPATQNPGALAYALPYERIHIVVLLDRVRKKAADTAQIAAVLAHVMAHEVTHILQGTARHSESGVMKAQWDAQDFQRMASKPLPFGPLDVVLIRNGLHPPASAATSAAPEAGTAAAAQLRPSL